MKIASLTWDGEARVGIVDAAKGSVTVKRLSPAEFWLRDDAVRIESLERAETVGEAPVDEAALLPPVPRPRKLICVAGNYYAHLKEGGFDDEVGEPRPQLFLKPASTSLLPHRGTFAIPKSAGFIDYEAELAVVIGKRIYQAPDRSAALGAVLGYSAFNDVSERELRIDPRNDRRPNTPFFDWLVGKWLNGGAPMGPWVTTADEIPDPQNLTIELFLNGRRMQSASTALMMSPVSDIVWYASQVMTLEPGDVIATGTPAGVGHPQGIAIKPGDETRVVIERIGELVTHFADAGAGAG